jgi:hypothetical protein
VARAPPQAADRRDQHRLEGWLMDKIERLLSELRSELEDIDQSILSMKRSDPFNSGTANGNPKQSIIEIRGNKEPESGS